MCNTDEIGLEDEAHDRRRVHQTFLIEVATCRAKQKPLKNCKSRIYEFAVGEGNGVAVLPVMCLGVSGSAVELQMTEERVEMKS